MMMKMRQLLQTALRLFQIILLAIILLPAESFPQSREIIFPDNEPVKNREKLSAFKSEHTGEFDSVEKTESPAIKSEEVKDKRVSIEQDEAEPTILKSPDLEDSEQFTTIRGKGRETGKDFDETKNNSRFKERFRWKPAPIQFPEYSGKKPEEITTYDQTTDPSQFGKNFHWKPALIQSGIFLGIKHGVRLFQRKTYRELGGPFFRDWGNSIKNLRGWNDGDSPFTNNFAHPLQGGVTGRIFVNNSDRAKKLEFGKSKDYWESRFKAFVWSTAWSTQFEFGPFSEATIGNVGLRQKNGHSTMAWTDLVLTPVVGTAVLIEEDMIDRFILKNWLERKNNYRLTTRIKILRSVLTPTTTFTNLLRGKVPWKRNTR